MEVQVQDKGESHFYSLFDPGFSRSAPCLGLYRALLELDALLVSALGMSFLVFFLSP